VRAYLAGLLHVDPRCNPDLIQIKQSRQCQWSAGNRSRLMGRISRQVKHIAACHLQAPRQHLLAIGVLVALE